MQQKRERDAKLEKMPLQNLSSNKEVITVSSKLARAIEGV
jgi:hypothetical protein